MRHVFQLPLLVAATENGLSRMYYFRISHSEIIIGGYMENQLRAGPRIANWTCITATDIMRDAGNRREIGSLYFPVDPLETIRDRKAG